MLNEDDIEILLEGLDLWEKLQDTMIETSENITESIVGRIQGLPSFLEHTNLQEMISEKANGMAREAKVNKEKATFLKVKLYQLRNKVVAQEGANILRDGE